MSRQADVCVLAEIDRRNWWGWWLCTSEPSASRLRLPISPQPQNSKKQIKKIPIKLPDHNYQPSMKELREEIHIPVSPDELAELVVRDYEIDYEK